LESVVEWIRGVRRQGLARLSWGGDMLVGSVKGFAGSLVAFYVLVLRYLASWMEYL
jgi:hypothetical protein